MAVNNHNDSFIINDIKLTIPPTQISITKDSFNNIWPTLRTRTSQKTKSGHSNIIVNCTVAFIGINEINTKLKPLIAQLRYYPFCYVENQHIRETLFPKEKQISDDDGFSVSENTIVLAMQGATIGMVAGQPETVWVEFQFYYFNYFPYVPTWQYKKDLFDTAASGGTVPTPAESKAWRQFVGHKERLGGVANKLPPYVGIEFVELITAPTGSVLGLESAVQALEALSHNPPDFFNYIRNNPSSNPELAFKNAARSALPGFADVENIGALDIIMPIILDAGPRSNPHSSVYKSNGQYVDQNKLRAAISELNNRIDASISNSSQLEKIVEDDFKLIDGLTGQDNRGQNFGIFSRKRGVDLTPENGIIVTGIAISISNILTVIPVLSHKYPTLQHVGSIDASVSLDIRVTSDKGLRSLNWFYDQVNENTLQNRHVPQGLQTVKVKNEFLSVFNLEEFMTGDMQTDTIPGSPGTYSVQLTLVEAGLKSSDKLLDADAGETFSVEYVANDDAAVRELVKILNRNVSISQRNKKSGLLVKKTGSEKNSAISDLLDKYLSSQEFETFSLKEESDRGRTSANLMFTDKKKKRLTNSFSQIKNPTTSNVSFSYTYGASNALIAPKALNLMSLNIFVDSLERIISKNQSKNSFIVLFGLTDEDLPGISLAQEALYSRFKNNKENQIPGIQTILNANKTLPELVKYSRKNTLGKSNLSQLLNERKTYRELNFTNQDVEKNTDLLLEAQAKDTTLLAIGPHFQVTETTVRGGDKSFEERISKEREYSEKLLTTPSDLLNTGAVAEWIRFIADLTKHVINSELLDLPEMRTLKKIVSDKAINRGLPAYRDFEFENIINDLDIQNNNSVLVSPLISNNDKQFNFVEKEDLTLQSNALMALSLDPDSFLFSPTDVDISNYVDATLLNQAKNHAGTSAKEAVSQIRNFYDKSWFPDFISDYIQEKVEENIGASINKEGKDEPAFKSKGINQYYDGANNTGDFYNGASGIGHKTQKISNFIDKKETHNTKSEELEIQSTRALKHSLDPSYLFDTQGAVSSDTILAPGSNPTAQDLSVSPDLTSDPIPNSKFSSFAAGYQLYAPLSGELRIAGPSGHFDARRREKVNTGDAVTSFAPGESRPHKGVDLLAKNGDNGDPGSPVFAVADGVIVKIGFDGPRFRILIRHKDGSSSNYQHLYEPLKINGTYSIGGQPLYNGIKVFGGQQIGNADRTGIDNKNTATHLHLIFKNKTGIEIDPAKFIPITSFKGNRQIPLGNLGAKGGPPDVGINAGKSVLDRSVEEFNKSLKLGQGQRLVRAFPAFKLYFIHDDSQKRRKFGIDDFFSYNAVSDITCIRDREIPADLLEITLTNVSGVLSNRKFQGPRKFDGTDPLGKDVSEQAIRKTTDSGSLIPTKDTANENPLESLSIKPGIDVELRLGYSNDPAKLSTVFNGKVQEVEFSESDDMVRIICQSHAVELVQDIKGLTKPEELSGWFVNDARTDRVLENMMSQPELIHFGRLEKKSNNKNRFLLTDKFSLTASVQDDNIFVPPVHKLNEQDPGWLASLLPGGETGLSYFIYQTTIWDIFHEMTLRHPGWIKSPVPYRGKNGPRMTMFFGLPSQLYFSADPDQKELTEGAKLKAAVERNNNAVDKLEDPNTSIEEVSKIGKQIAQDPSISTKRRNFEEERLRLAKDSQSIKPFRSYHVLTSKNHIVSNNIRASSKNTFNTVSIQYAYSEWNDKTNQLVQNDSDILTLSIDAALPDEEVRELFVQYSNCQHELLAKQYALSILMEQMKDVYKGEITIIGNPDIKPYDICYLFDDYSDLMGPIEVKRVIHRFSKDTGFITEITPDLFVTSNEWMNQTAADYMALIAEGTISTFLNSSPTFTEKSEIFHGGLTTTAGLAGGLLGGPLGAVVGFGLGMAGMFVAEKMVDFSNYGQPIVIHPLMHRGKPFMAGLPAEKLNNLWTVDKGKWFKEGIKGTGLWLGHIYDNIIPTIEPQGKFLNLFSGSTIPPKF